MRRVLIAIIALMFIEAQAQNMQAVLRRAGVIAGARSSWSPNSITNMGIWFDADYADSITMTGTSVEQWDSRVGSVYAIPYYGTNYAHITETLNNKNVVTFERPEFYTITNYTGNLNAMTTFIVGRYATNITGVSDYFMSGREEMAAGDRYYPFWVNGDLLHCYIGSAAFSCGDVDLSNSVFSAYNAGNTAEARKNGNIVGSQVTALGTSIDYWFIAGNAGTPRLDGNIAEVLHYDRGLTSNEIDQCEGYLAHKWGLETKLPATHPYKSKGPE